MHTDEIMMKEKPSNLRKNFYSTALTSYMKFLSRNVLLWSGIIPCKTGSLKPQGKSAIVESAFSKLKNHIMNGKKTCCECIP
jgi:hypothetical protein